jgi:5-bromo-4-chloroindolyl phosphate hydrolysis protein
MPPLAKAALLLAAIFALLALGLKIAAKFRYGNDEEGLSAQEMLNRFRESHEKGQLSDAEYQAIRRKLAAQVQAELNDTNQPG